MMKAEHFQSHFIPHLYAQKCSCLPFYLNKIPMLPLFKEGNVLEILLMLSLPGVDNNSFSSFLFPGCACFGFALTKIQTHCIVLQIGSPRWKVTHESSWVLLFKLLTGESMKKRKLFLG
jgi:hypothetical protein